jgi:hypothetical protein
MKIESKVLIALIGMQFQASAMDGIPENCIIDSDNQIDQILDQATNITLTLTPPTFADLAHLEISTITTDGKTVTKILPDGVPLPPERAYPDFSKYMPQSPKKQAKNSGVKNIGN